MEPLTLSRRWFLNRLYRRRRMSATLTLWLCILVFVFAACDSQATTRPTAQTPALESASPESRQLTVNQQATPVPTRTPVPTFTPTPTDLLPLVIITPPQEQTPGVIIVQPGMEAQVILPTPVPPTDTPTVPPPTPLPPTETPTPTPTFTGTPTATPTPFVEIESGLVTLRSGPGVNYPLVAQLGPDIPVTLVGRNSEGNWLQICCINGADAWVARQHVLIFNDITNVPLVNPGPAPTPTETATPTATATATPFLYPFERLIGPQFTPTNNEFLTIYVKLVVGPLEATQLQNNDLQVPADGYFLEVEFEGFDRPNRYGEVPSGDSWDFSAPVGAGNRLAYNLKYEYHPNNVNQPPLPGTNATPTAVQLIGEGTWTVWVKDGVGNQLSDKVTFTTAPFNTNREVYIAWQRVR